MANYHQMGQYRKTNTLAIISLVLGILSVLFLILSFCGFGYFSLIFGLPAAILGFMARKQIDGSRGTETGRGLAIAGLITGTISVVVWLIILIFTGLLAAIFTGWLASF